MSAEQRGPTPARSAADRTRTVPHLTTGSDDRTASPLYRPAADSDRRDSPLSSRIERTRLRTRIAALECALETSERRRQAVIDRYERLLADRDDSTDSPSELSDSQSQSLLARLIDR
ncbi:hypothetical protein [Natrinema versiforme]|uniref:Uncharacterized protein n=1 Tax=Natrinema versiforme JCM 10478 TaxID=1227496 RepID=L9XTZ7_9EURY|nr:hypothetical protein [Natrinema versiforme]ELY64881.1 hypothetical protein C489_15741 [Natrinema versiforme JCM 10478]